MRVRFTRSLGLPVVDDETGDLLGTLSGILLHPDTGVVEGFFVRPNGFASQDLFLGSMDILHWGLRITVRHGDALAPLEERIRLQPLLSDPRTVLGQTIRTEGGRTVGRCADIQFSTEHFRLEWLFPRRFFRWGIPIPASQILVVRQDAVVIREQEQPSAEKDDVGIMPPLPEAA